MLIIKLDCFWFSTSIFLKLFRKFNLFLLQNLKFFKFFKIRNVFGILNNNLLIRLSLSHVSLIDFLLPRLLSKIQITIIIIILLAGNHLLCLISPLISHLVSVSVRLRLSRVYTWNSGEVAIFLYPLIITRSREIVNWMLHFLILNHVEWRGIVIILSLLYFSVG